MLPPCVLQEPAIVEMSQAARQFARLLLREASSVYARASGGAADEAQSCSVTMGGAGCTWLPPT